jgi:hypothetical protein
MTSVKSFARRVVIAAPLALAASAFVVAGLAAASSAADRNATGTRALNSENAVVTVSADWPWSGERPNRPVVTNVDWPWSICNPTGPTGPTPDPTNPVHGPGDWPWSVDSLTA